MPWKETGVLELRLEFVLRALGCERDFGELCKEYGISRKTGYKWKERFLEKGACGLYDESRRPKRSPNEMAEDVVCEIIRIKKDHLHWGPVKIREVYARKHSYAEVPAESTFKRILKKAGLTEERKVRRHDTCGRIENRVVPTAPNDVWTTDFKGWWYTRDKQRCEPLTVRDEFSRFILCATPVENAKSTTVRRHFEQLFERYGLPRTIRSDNGPPFACTTAPRGLSRLSAWWVSFGINLDRIPPGRPDQNGGHERMHRDIAAEVEISPSATLREQSAILETWRHHFNFERPHQALQLRVPGEIYHNSERPYSSAPIEIHYPVGFISRKVDTIGRIKLDATRILISSALHQWHVGLKPDGDHHYLVWFGPLCLGTIDTTTETFTRADEPTIARMETQC